MNFKQLMMGSGTITGTSSDALTGLILRLFAGGVMFAHGAQKLLGWFGGHGFSGSMQYFTETRDMPWLLGFLVIILESIGCVMLIAGLGTRFIAFSLVIVVLGIILTSQIQYGFYMNWYGNKAGEGFEFSLLMIGLLLAIVVQGPGKWSMDKVFDNK